MLVGKEGFCDFPTIQAAVDALELLDPAAEETLYILPGVYKEEVRIYRSYLTIIGIGQVEITMNRYARESDDRGEEIGTFATPTLFLGGRKLVLENLIITNTAGQGEEVGQAVAVYAHCDEAVFRNCMFKGHQDTLFTGPLPPAPKERRQFGGIALREHHAQYRQLYQHCYIEGTVDFIFGGATAYFEHCELHSLRSSRDQTGYITAASTPAGQAFGYVFKHCYLTAEPGIAPVFLGRPWREHAKTAFVDCRMGKHIHPLGWDNWNQPANEETVTYREYAGEQAAVLRELRVPWAEVRGSGSKVLTKEQVLAGFEYQE
jgi:pectinesterase